MATHHNSWCSQNNPLCECEFWHRYQSRIWRLYWRFNRGCKHKVKQGSYGSNDAWCPRCGRVWCPMPHVGEL